MKTTGHFEFHFCFEEPGGSGGVIGFDLYFSWREVLPEGIERAAWKSEDLVLKAESMCVDADWNFMPLFDVRHSRDQRHFELSKRLKGRKGRKNAERLRVPLRGYGSGGNWYWEVYLTSARRSPHLMNWLKRCKGLDVTQWDGEFRKRVWGKRGSIRMEDLREFHRSMVRSYREAAIEA
jgi:hypothetical protein